MATRARQYRGVLWAAAAKITVPDEGTSSFLEELEAEGKCKDGAH